MSEKEKTFSRTLRTRVRGKMLKIFDIKCAKQELNESDAIREAIRLWVNYEKYASIPIEQIKNL